MNKINHKKLGVSFRCAFNGVWQLLLTEQNARVHLTIAIFVGIMAYLLHIPKAEVIILFIMATLVFLSEIVNTAIEKLLDHIHPHHHQSVKIIKDAMAGAVLITCISAAIVGCLIFIPHLWRMIF